MNVNAVYWAPASEWWISPSLVNVGFDRRRKNRACSNADRTRSVVFDIDARQPRMRREYTSVTKLTYTNPAIVQT